MDLNYCVGLLIVCALPLGCHGCRRSSTDVKEVGTPASLPIESDAGGSAETFEIMPQLELFEECGILLLETTSESLSNPTHAFGTLKVFSFSSLERDAEKIDNKFRDKKLVLSVNFVGNSPYRWTVGPDKIVITNIRDRTHLELVNPRVNQPITSDQTRNLPPADVEGEPTNTSGAEPARGRSAPHRSQAPHHEAQ